jgi:DNA-binding NarL/FixJ family response regulator
LKNYYGVSCLELRIFKKEDTAMFRTLIIEDNVIFRRSLRAMIHRHFPFMSIDEAGEGTEAKEKVAACCPDLIFMDIKLPGENGLELTKAIKQEHKKVIIIILTAYDLPEYRNAAYHYGANYLIAKGSSSRDELVATVETILEELGFEWRGNSAGEGAL